MVNENNQNLKIIVFQLVDEEYAIPVNQVGSIERMQHITRVPRAGRHVKGVINLRGVVTPILDLRKKFNMKETEPTEATRIIIVHLKRLEVGLIVDAAYDVMNISKESVEPAPEVITSVKDDQIEGVANLGDRLIILLNMEKVLSDNESTDHEMAGNK